MTAWFPASTERRTHSIPAKGRSLFALFVVLSIGVLGLSFVGGDGPSMAEAPPASVSKPMTTGETKVYDSKIKPFLKQYCIGCHGKDESMAGLRLDNLGTDFLEGKTANVWKEVINKLNVGAMPPKDEDVPKPAAKEGFVVVEWVNQGLRNAEKRAQSAGGRVPMRRMNRTEYANTVRDLFFLDDHFARKIERELPTDGKVDGFDRGGAALLVDKSQLQIYMEVARAVVAEAMPTEPPKVNKYRIEALKDQWLTHTMPKQRSR